MTPKEILIDNIDNFWMPLFSSDLLAKNQGFKLNTDENCKLLAQDLKHINSILKGETDGSTFPEGGKL